MVGDVLLLIVLLAVIVGLAIFTEKMGGYTYDPHHDPLFMQGHDPLYCPVCKAQREGRSH